MSNTRPRQLVAALTLSAIGFAAWMGSEGFTSTAIIPTQGDVPTIGYGSTRYEDGTPVTLKDPAITPQRAEQLARNLHSEEEQRFRASIPGVELFQEEYDLYLDFTGQYGIGNWRSSSMRRHLLAGEYVAACHALLRFRHAGGYDCSTRINGQPNRRCWGVWERQVKRHAQCLAVQP
ncbi:glycoside hydrolase family protein [Stutzerimonas nitrititolerans]|uniref:glycoside hydrolase family protein n=1 Tax=Stutzerimonas nitrititolerans TaxID=2482751 RepID=UPI0028A898CA|nr:glycoside hydrolase family protein [Stutzerimonas nitrititolerans]